MSYTSGSSTQQEFHLIRLAPLLDDIPLNDAEYFIFISYPKLSNIAERKINMLKGPEKSKYNQHPPPPSPTLLRFLNFLRANLYK